jgi:predicted nucleic acid-binding protein
VIHLDTSVLIDAFAGPRRTAAGLRSAIADGERIAFSTLVLYEWLRGPRRPEELRAQEALFPRESAAPFGVDEASVAAALYAALPRARGRELDLAIAACAITHGAYFWTLNPGDFRDLPRLRLFDGR